ncbi:MAG: NADPH-dependent F420 reductase [Myxococcota bacterium]
MKIAIVGGTGKEGSGLAVRWLNHGHTVMIGSRDADKGRAHGEKLGVQGMGNEQAAGMAEVVVLTVPYSAHASTLEAIAPQLRGKILIDVTVPLRPPKVSRVQLPPGGAAALEAQAIVGPDTPVVATLHHVSHTHLAGTGTIECDVLVATDDARAREVTLELLRDLGLRGLDAGPLANAVALESLTPVLIHLNRRYKISNAGVVFSGIGSTD